MMDDIQERIRQRAYELWEASGKSEGSEMDFWLQAEREIKEGKSSDASTTEPIPEQRS
jgi:hypothetical protein